MHRRTYVTSIIGSGVIGLAGCIADNPDENEPSENGRSNEEDETENESSDENEESDNESQDVGEEMGNESEEEEEVTDLPTIDGTDLEVEAGYEDAITIEVEHVGSVQISTLPESDVTIAVTEARFSEDPRSQDDSHPPYWNWSLRAVSREIVIPVRIDDTADPDDYHYTVSAWDFDEETHPDMTRNQDNAVTEEFTITVGEN